MLRACLIVAIVALSAAPYVRSSGTCQCGVAPANESENDDATQTRIRELIYVLRQYRVSQRKDEWGAAIRELVEIGPPACPELLLELKNTERGATLRGLLFTLRAINDPRSVPFVIEAIPKAERLSGGSDSGLAFANPDLRRFMKQHEDFPSDDDSVSYGRAVNEIYATLHKLNRKPLPDFTKPGPYPTWNKHYWQEWWKVESKSGAPASNKTIVLPSRNEDLVQLDGVRRFGTLFPTGPGQRLNSVVQIRLASANFADAKSCIDLDTGQLFENLEGLSYGPTKAFDRFASMKWQISRGVDLTIFGVADMHLWLIDNNRWDLLDSEVPSNEPLNLGSEANSITPFADPNQIGTFLFTTREGSRGVMRVYPTDKSSQTRKIEYRLWNRDTAKPVTPVPTPHRQPGAWHPAKMVILKEPGFGNQCLFDLEDGKTNVLSTAIFAPDAFPKIEELLRVGGLLSNDRLAGWARKRGIDVATHPLTVISEKTARDVGDAPSNGQILALTILDGRVIHATAEAFDSLTVGHAKEIVARRPSAYKLEWIHAPFERDTPQRTYIFETKSGTLGLLQILEAVDTRSSIVFRYKLAG